MFLPLADENPYRRIAAPTITWSLILVNVAIFLFTYGLASERMAVASALGFGLIPAVLNETAALSPELVVVPASMTWLTHMFMHAGWMHLIGNMLFLWVFADNVEDSMGHLRFLAFYLVCGFAGAFAHLFMNPASQAPLVGASGAISGVLAAYLMLFPRVRVFGLIFNALPVRLPVWLALGAWIGLQFFQLLYAGDSGTAWWAHVGGLVAGAALVAVFKRADAPLFAQERSLPLVLPGIAIGRR